VTSSPGASTGIPAGRERSVQRRCARRQGPRRPIREPRRRRPRAHRLDRLYVPAHSDRGRAWRPRRRANRGTRALKSSLSVPSSSAMVTIATIVSRSTSSNGIACPRACARPRYRCAHAREQQDESHRVEAARLEGPLVRHHQPRDLVTQALTNGPDCAKGRFHQLGTSSLHERAARVDARQYRSGGARRVACLEPRSRRSRSKRSVRAHTRLAWV